MNIDDYSVVLLNDFLLNAGVVGLLRIFKYAADFDGGCEEGVDYIIEGQQLFIRKDFLQNRNIGELFVRTMVAHLGPSTKYQRVLSAKSRLDAMYQQPNKEDKQWQKGVDEIINEFADMLNKNSFKSGYVILSQCKGITVPTAEMVAALKREKEYLHKKELYDGLYDLLQQKKVEEILTFKDILYSVINMFYADNQGSGAAFLSKREIEPAEAYNMEFIAPLRAELAGGPAKSTGVCIGCNATAAKKNLISITKFVDTADDLGKKKSYYWNCNPDAYLCPLCAFICSLAPLGFTYLGYDGVFINNNSEVEMLWGFANALEESRTEEEGNSWFKLYNTFTSEKIHRLSHRASNIQVIIREKKTGKYSLHMIDKATVTLLDKHNGEFQQIKNRYFTDGQEFINIYQQTVENIIHKRNQFAFIARLLRVSFSSDDQHAGCLFNILLIQIAQKGGENVDNNTKRAYVAKKQGEILRAKLTENLSEADRDNKLRGLVYQLLNAVSLGNRDKFMELVLRTYAGANLPVPDIFFTCFGGDEQFKEIGFAYLLGLKTAGYKNEEGNA